MNCMKCGAELETEQAFCEDCLLDMEKYPVEPGTAVHLPLRRETAGTRKSPRRRSFSLEEQVSTLKRRIRVLTALWIVTLLLLLAAIYPAVNYFTRNYYLRPGQNYTAITTITPGNAPAETAD